MCTLSSEEFFLWKDDQISRGGDEESLFLLIDFLGGISKKDFNLLKLKQVSNIKTKTNLNLLSIYWDEHLKTSIPIQHMIKNCYWRDLKLHVSNKVLIPRSETELIIDIVSDLLINKSKKIIFADLGTGSGAIGIALAINNPNWDGIATDIDQKALEIAKKNFEMCSNQSNLSFYCGNWWNPLDNYKGILDLAIANPPYIPSSVYENLPIGVKNFEPKTALWGGEDGLDHIEQIIHNAPRYLKEKGWLLLENHYDQAKKVKKLFQKNDFTSVEVVKDLSGIGRFTIGRYK